MTDTANIARAVLAKAKALDPRMPQPDRAVLLAWTDVFADQPIWLPDALTAVSEHYRSTNDRLMPADVLRLIREMPLKFASEDRIRAWVDHWVNHPFTETVTDATGLVWERPRLDPVVEARRDTEIAALSAHRREWAEMMIDRIIEVIRSGRRAGA